MCGSVYETLVKEIKEQTLLTHGGADDAKDQFNIGDKDADHQGGGDDAAGDDVEPHGGDVVRHQLWRSDTLVGLQQQQQQQVMLLNLTEGM
jgi:hypothetical protein